MIKTEQELSVKITKQEWLSAQKMLKELGFGQIMYQEKKRISYLYPKLDVRFDIDTWPQIPSYVEIEGKNKKSILEAAKLIGYKSQDLLSIKGKELFSKYSVNPAYLIFKKGQSQTLCNN